MVENAAQRRQAHEGGIEPAAKDASMVTIDALDKLGASHDEISF